MPYVFVVRKIIGGVATNYFAITGQIFASRSIDQAGGRAVKTTITCQVTADLSSYSTVSGTMNISIIFDDGGRTQTTDAASYWISDSNTVTFNGDLTSKFLLFHPISPPGRLLSH
jgi:hypothetical protein